MFSAVVVNMKCLIQGHSFVSHLSIHYQFSTDFFFLWQEMNVSAYMAHQPQQGQPTKMWLLEND